MVVGIIGGGASGMASALAAAENEIVAGLLNGETGWIGATKSANDWQWADGSPGTGATMGRMLLLQNLR